MTLPQVIAPPDPPEIDASAKLGCGVARAEIWTRGGLARVMDLPNINSTQWGRVRSDVSAGSVELDGVAIGANAACCALLNTIAPWEHELFVYRDDELAWCGPIVQMELDGPKLTIKARDLMAWCDQRFIHFAHQYGGTQANQGSEDSAGIFQDIVTDAFATDTSPLGANLAGTPFLSGTLQAWDMAQRTYTPAQFKPCGPECRDLAKSSLDWTIVKRAGTLGAASYQQVLPNPVVDNTFGVTGSMTGWTGFTADNTVAPPTGGGTFSARTAGTPNVTGSIVGLTIGEKYQLRYYIRGTSSALDAAQVPNYDGVVKVGNDQSAVWSWYVYGQPTSPTHDNRGRTVWFQMAVNFTATATTMPITITASGAPQDSHGIYFSKFEVWQQVPSFTLRDYSLAVPPKITLDGLTQKNRAIVANQQSGGDYAFYAEAPKPAWTLGSTNPPGGSLTPNQIQYGLLEDITTQPLSDSTSAASSAAYQAATLGSTPLVIDNLVLSPDAGVTMAQLIPGVLFTLRLDEPCFAVQSDLILQTVDVKTDPANGEVVTLTPTGF